MTVWGERFAALLCILVAAYLAMIAWEFPAGGDQFPLFCCFAIIAIAILMIVRSFLSPGVFKKTYEFETIGAQARPLLLTAGVVVYVLLIFQLGYFTSSALFLIATTFAVGVHNIKAIALTVIITFPLMYAFFELFLQAQLPRGMLI